MTVTVNLFRRRAFSWLSPTSKIVRHYYTISAPDFFNLGVPDYSNGVFYDASPGDIASDPNTYFANLAAAESYMLSSCWTNILGNLNTGFDPLAGTYVQGSVVDLDDLTQSKLDAKFNIPSGSTSQYVRGDGSLATLPTIPTRSFANPSRTLNSAYQISTTRDSMVSYSVDVSCALSLTGGQTGTVFLEYADDSGFTTGVTEVNRFVNGNTGTLTVGLNITQNATGALSGGIPANKYVRLRTANTVGTPTFTFRSAQEVLL